MAKRRAKPLTRTQPGIKFTKYKYAVSNAAKEM